MEAAQKPSTITTDKSCFNTPVTSFSNSLARKTQWTDITVLKYRSSVPTSRTSDDPFRQSPSRSSGLPASPANSALADIEATSRHEPDDWSPSISGFQFPLRSGVSSTNDSTGRSLDEGCQSAKSFRCNFCSRSFEKSISRNTHERKHNSVSKKYSCAVPSCAMRFANRGNLNRHINSVGQIHSWALKEHAHAILRSTLRQNSSHAMDVTEPFTGRTICSSNIPFHVNCGSLY